jgi:SpoIID/LytB domain protein
VIGINKLKLIAALSVFLILTFLLIPAFAGAEVYIKIKGRGFGHGVGMCQYGANGLANSGKNYKDILKYYFKSITVSTYAEAIPTVRVLLKEISSGYLEIKGTPSITIINEASGGTVITGFTGKIRLKAGTSGVVVEKEVSGSFVQVGVYTGPLRISAPASGNWYLSFFDGKEYQYKGYFKAVYNSTKKTVLLINYIDLENYVYGIAEMPSSWNMEALKAQAVAARTYAYIRKGSSGTYDLFDDQNSQVYVGLNKINEPTYGLRWKQACDGTYKEISYYDGKPAHVYYHSTCGGHTEDSEDVWSTAYPEARGVPCTYCSSSPYYQWETTITLSQLRNAFSDQSISYAQVVERIENRRVKTVRLYRTNGTYTDVYGSTFRSKLGLRSTWFFISAERIAGADRFETNTMASRKVFSSSQAIVLVNSDAFIDAICASPLAGFFNSPILLTKKDIIPYVVKNEIKRLNPVKCYIIGGTGVVSVSVESELKSLIPSVSIVRLGGKDRFETSFKIVDELVKKGADSSKAVLINAYSAADAISVSPLAYASKLPVVLTETDSIKNASRDAIRELDPDSLLIIGGTGAVSEELEESIKSEFGISEIARWAGSDRFETSYIAAKNSLSSGLSSSGCALVGDGKYPDALSASFFCGKLKIPVLLVRPDSPTYWARKFVEEFLPVDKYVIGGTGAVSYESEFYCFSY